MNNKKKYKKYQIGDFSYGSPTIMDWNNGTKLEIGKFCSIADGVVILLGGEHRIDWVTTYPFNIFFNEFKCFKGHPTTKGDICIGNDVWIGKNVTILSGVEIGDGAVIGASSVVTKSIKPYSIVAGNPVKFIKLRFDEKTIECLLKIAWWDWDFYKIKNNMHLLLSNKIQEFIDKNI